jgi:SPP1 gp7 family putative phage head morphogenesis protein
LKRQPPSKPQRFKEAVEWFRERVPLTKDVWLELEERAQAKAFTIAGVAQLEMVAEVFDDLNESLLRGESLDDFKGRVSQKLASAWGEDRPWHVENVFRTNLQRAYSHARHEQMSEPAVVADRPFKMFAATLDSRTTDICRPLHGTILRADHPWWKTHMPPLHFQCRSAHILLSADLAREMGGTSKRAPDVPAMEGFGLLDDWEPDLNAYPPELVRLYDRER